MLKARISLLLLAFLATGAHAQNVSIRKQFARDSQETLKHSSNSVDNVSTGGPDETFFVFHEAEIKHEWCDDITKNQRFVAALQSMGFTEIICSYGTGNARFVFDLLFQQQPTPAQTQSQLASACTITAQDMDLAHKANDLATRIIDDLRVAHANRGANMSDRKKVLQRLLHQMIELQEINKQLTPHSTTLAGCPMETAGEWVRLATERANLMDEAMNEIDSYQTLIH